MRDEIYIGESPCEEDCAQLGSDNYRAIARFECNMYIEAIKRKLGEPPHGARLKIKANPHDFGTYFSVMCEYDDDNEVAANYAFDCESMAPENWTPDEKRRLLAFKKELEPKPWPSVMSMTVGDVLNAKNNGLL